MLLTSEVWLALTYILGLVGVNQNFGGVYSILLN